MNGGRGMHFYFLKVLCMERGIQPGSHTTVVDFASLLRGKSRRAELGENPPGTGVNSELAKSR